MKKASVSPIEQFVIDRIRTIRKEKGISQRDLSAMTDLSIGFIGDVEGVKGRAKYNLNHINAIAKAFECSPKDFFPDMPL